MKRYLGVLFAVLLTVACLVVPASAVDESIDFDSVLESYSMDLSEWDYFVCEYEANGLRTAICWQKSFIKVSNVSSRSWTLCNFSDVDALTYTFELRNTGWVRYSASTISAGGSPHSFGNPFTILSSSVDLYDSNGELFFQVPPAPQPGLGETVEALTLNQGEAIRNQAVGVMKILAPCGVGCLALLMVFPALKKGLFRFLT